MHHHTTHPMPAVAAHRPGRGLAVASLVVGIVGAGVGIIPLLAIPAIILGILGITFGALGRRHGIGKAGMVLGVVAVALGIIGLVIIGQVVEDLEEDLDDLTESAECVDLFVPGEQITQEAAGADQCSLDGESWFVTTLDCSDGRTLVHPVTGWGYVGEPFRTDLTLAGGIPDAAFAACIG